MDGALIHTRVILTQAKKKTILQFVTSHIEESHFSIRSPVLYTP